jgi:uncharacterized RDD family membrane protein YckC
VSLQPPDGDPGSDPVDPQATRPPPGPDADTTRLPWDQPPTTPPAPPPASAGWAAPAPSGNEPVGASGSPGGEPPAVPPVPPAGAPGAPGSTGPSVLWASPAAPVSQEIPGAPGLSFADTASRFVAYVLDSIIVSIIGSIIAGILGLGRGTLVTSGSTTSANYVVTGGAFLVPYAVIGFLYFVFFWTGGRRATPGQQLFKLQVGNAFDGMALTMTQAVKRWFALGTFLSLFSILPAIYPLASLVELVWVIALFVTTVRSPTKQGFHDKFANSAVVRPSGQSSSALLLTCLIIILVLFALFVVSIIALVFLGSQLSTILSDVGNSI